MVHECFDVMRVGFSNKTVSVCLCVWFKQNWHWFGY